MTQARWERLRAIFDELVELPATEQGARLEQFTAGDPALRSELEALLVAARDVGDRFDAPPRLSVEVEHDRMAPGTRVGAYQIVREIGRGGMGAVYEATRADSEFVKRVALKMVPADRGTDAILRRFRYERQILARLEHRNIAALLDGGAADDGRPFFAMEFVEGERIDRYCDRRRLGIRDRLQLFRQVCAAVHYAHQNLVVHRDLKPGNILVGADGTVKLLDFGIAKLVESTDDEDPLTQAGVLPMTTAYASPEQLKGEPVTTATDIYSLGVILYELLAGRPPFVDPGLPVLEMRRRMLDATPLPPSEVATDALAVGSGEGTVARLKRTLAGELDNIVLMALRKEPDRRYASAEQLGEDALRFLAGLPVLAQPDSLAYRVRKLVRRNRAAVASGMIAVLAMVGGTVASLWQARAARQERDRAQLAEQTATQVTEFFRSILTSAKPVELGKGATVLEAIDRTTAHFDSAFRDNPKLKAAVASSLGSVLHDMGEYERALPLSKAAHEYYRRAAMPSKEAAEAEYNYSMALWNTGALAPAESLMRHSLEQYRAAGEPAPEVAIGYGQLAQILDDRGDRAGAIAMSAAVLDTLERYPAYRGSLALARLNHGTYVAQSSRYEEAVPVFRQAVADFIALYGEADSRVGAALQPLSYALMVLGDFPGADSAARRSVANREAALGRTDPRTLTSLRTLGEIALERGRPAEALPLLEEIVALRGRGLSDGSPELAAAYALSARSKVLVGRPGEALRDAEESRRLRIQGVGAGHWLVYASEAAIGQALAGLGRLDEAETALARAVEGLERTVGANHFRTRQARRELERLRR